MPTTMPIFHENAYAATPAADSMMKISSGA